MQIPSILSAERRGRWTLTSWTSKCCVCSVSVFPFHFVSWFGEDLGGQSALSTEWELPGLLFGVAFLTTSGNEPGEVVLTCHSSA